MTAAQTFFTAVSAIILFLYALKGFSREIQDVGGATLRARLTRVTSNKWKAFAVGAVATAIIQSSTAVTALAVTLVEAGALPFRASLGVVLGANPGTTTTAWLIALKVTQIGPVFIVLGALVSTIPNRFRILGQGIFYFGLIFFTLELISSSLAPVRNHPYLVEFLSYARNPLLGVLIGIVFTVIVQASTVTAGLAILLVQQGILPAEAAIPIAIGANAGTPSTALIVSASMGATARATAVANFLFNFVGVLILTPFLRPFSAAMLDVAGSPDRAVALAHLVFNVAIGIGFLLPLGRIAPVFERRIAASRLAR